MLLVLGFCHRDATLAIKNAQLMAHLDSYPNHTLLLCYNQEAQKTDYPKQIRQILDGKFKEILPDFVPYDSDERKWPMAQNHLFRRVAFYIQENIKQDWLWMEADAFALKRGWMDDIESEYKACGKPFMGDGVNLERAVTHMSGIAVYPWNSIELATNINVAESTAWDLYAAKQIMPRAHYTKKIHHVFWQSENPDSAPTFPTQESLSYIRPEALIFHRCKDGTIADRIMEKSGASYSISIPETLKKMEVRMTAQKTIHTYYTPVAEISTADAGKLIDLWSADWKEKGWNTVVLGEDDAKKHPLYNAAKMVFGKFPTVNPKGYEMACWMRWLAMANTGGWMCDYDVFPLDSDKLARNVLVDNKTSMSFFSGNDNDPIIPCLVHGEKSAYLDVVTQMLGLTPDGKHFSDMKALCGLFPNPTVEKKVFEYGESGWELSGAVHFSHHAMGDKKPKWKHIPKLLQEVNGKNEVSQPSTITAQPPLTIADQMRHYITELEKICDGKVGRILSLQSELRKRKLIPQARKR